MLRQLARLTAPVAAGGDHAIAIAVYADACDLVIPAADLGYEGVACVDDAARGLMLFCDLWERTGLPRFRAWSEGLLDFLLYMQAEDGRFINFITDWSGRRNEHGPTSFAGGGFWQARGVRAFAKAALVLGDRAAAQWAFARPARRSRAVVRRDGLVPSRRRALRRPRRGRAASVGPSTGGGARARRRVSRATAARRDRQTQ